MNEDLARQLQQLQAENDRLRLELARSQESEAVCRVSEKQTRDVFEGMALIALALDASGIVTYCNRMLCEISGWEKDEIVGHNWFEQFTPHPPETLELFHQLIASRDIQPLPRHENSIRIRSGEARWIRWSNTVLYNDEGAAVGVVSLGEDVTELRRAQEQIRELNATLEQRVAERTRELEQANVRLQQLAVEDGLTGLTNRRRFGEALDEEVRRSRRSGIPLSLLMADIDFFKGYNDHYGHPAGDRCLQAVANAIRSSFRRAGEVVARYGGEEFAIILPGLDAAAAVAAGERLRQIIEALQLPYAPAPLGHITISIGCTTLLKGCTSSPQELLDAADLAMYDSKHLGRNRVSSRAAA